MNLLKPEIDLIDTERPEGQESRISDEIRFRVGGVLKALKGVGSLLYAPIAIVRGNALNLRKSEAEARTIASHEVGHAITQLFLGQKPKGIYIIRNKELLGKLGLPSGSTSPDNPIISSLVLALSGHVSQGLMMAVYGKNGLSFDVDRTKDLAKITFLIESLAGEAAEIADKDNPDMDVELAGLKNKNIASDFSKVASTLGKSKSLNSNPEGTVAIVVKELVAFFNRPIMKKIRTAITEKVLEKDLLATFGDSLENKILKILEAAGVTREEYDTEKREMETLILRLETLTLS